MATTINPEKALTLKPSLGKQLEGFYLLTGLVAVLLMLWVVLLEGSLYWGIFYWVTICGLFLLGLYMQFLFNVPGRIVLGPDQVQLHSSSDNLAIETFNWKEVKEAKPGKRAYQLKLHTGKVYRLRAFGLTDEEFTSLVDYLDAQLERHEVPVGRKLNTDGSF